MEQPKFAVYYIPEGDDPFYQLGTQLLGYDVRARTSVTLPPGVQATLGRVEESWVLFSRPLGFHLTIGDAIDCDWSTIPLVEGELIDLPGCFEHDFSYSLAFMQQKL